MPTDLIQQPEGKTLEFKRDLSSPSPLLKTLVAFANSAGGRLVVGVADNREVVGVADPFAAEEKLANLIADSIAPRPGSGLESGAQSRAQSGAQSELESGPESRPDSRPESRPELGLESVISQKILDVLAEKTLSKSEIAHSIGHQTISGELKKRILFLESGGFIERTIPEKPNSRLQKYRLTPKGRKHLNLP